MGRICITLPGNIEETITKEAGAQGITKSEWIAQGLERYLITRDQKPDQGCDEVRTALQQLSIEKATLEERSKNQVTTIEDLRSRVVHDEGIIQTLMEERQKLLPEKTGFWSRLFHWK